MDARIDQVEPGGRHGCNTWLVGDSEDVILYCEELGVVFSGDALLADGPAPHAGEYPDFAGQLSAIGQELLTLPEETRVLPGHGEQITVKAAGQRFDSWVTEGPRPGDLRQ